MPNPWDRQTGETVKAFAAFCIYRDLPAIDRSIVAAVAEHRKHGGKASVRNWETWSSLYNWRERGLSSDSDLASRRRIRRAEALERAQDDISTMARAALAKMLPMLQPLESGGRVALTGQDGGPVKVDTKIRACLPANSGSVG